MKIQVVPEPSERCTTLTAVDGRDRPGFTALMAGSFHLVIVPM